MKFTCTKTNFNNGINIALKAVPGKTTMPILECVVIEAKGDMVKLTTNDMQLGIETKIPAEIEQDGIILVNAKMISEIVRRLPDDDVNFEVDENNNILLFCGKSKFNIPGIPHDEFPMLPKIEADKTIHISQFTLKEMIRQTIFSISDNESNKILTGELFEINGDEFKIASLDLVRVSIRKIHLKESYDPIKVVITNYPEGQSELCEVENNPAVPEMGVRDIPFSREIWVDGEDFMEVPAKKYFRLFPGNEVRLKGAYFITCQEAVKNEDGSIKELHCTYDPETKSGSGFEGRKVKGTIHFVDAATAVPIKIR